MKIKSYCFIVLLLAGCNSTSELSVAVPDVTPICTLQENLGLLGEVSSFDICDDSTFVLISKGEGTVYYYSVKGEQISMMDKKGRASFEYITPRFVRAGPGGGIYVWCSDSQRFIKYERDGSPILEFRYPSAVFDFMPISNDMIAVYTCGRRWKNIIDLVDSDTGLVLDSLGHASEAHQMLTSFSGRAAMALDSNGDLLFMPKDKLCILPYSIKNGRIGDKISFDSSSFKCAPMDSPFNGDVKTLLDYLNKNSSTVLLMEKRKALWVLSQEGVIGDENGAGGRFYSLYKIQSGKVVFSRNYMWKDLTVPDLFTIHDGEIFFVRIKPGSDSALWELCRWNVQ